MLSEFKWKPGQPCQKGLPSGGQHSLITPVQMQREDRLAGRGPQVHPLRAGAMGPLLFLPAAYLWIILGPFSFPSSALRLLPVHNTSVSSGAFHACPGAEMSCSERTHSCVRDTPVRGSSHALLMLLISFHPQMIA